MAIALHQVLLTQQIQEQALLLEQRVRERTRELEEANQQLEAFTYSVSFSGVGFSYDLQSPATHSRLCSGFKGRLFRSIG